MSSIQKKLATLSLAIALLAICSLGTQAMHIAEGYLPLGHCVFWGALCLPFVVAGLFSIRRTVANHRKTILILAMAGAYAFVLSALKITFRCAMMTLLSVPVPGGWWLTSFRVRSIIGVEREPAGNTVSPQILSLENDRIPWLGAVIFFCPNRSTGSTETRRNPGA